MHNHDSKASTLLNNAILELIEDANFEIDDAACSRLIHYCKNTVIRLLNDADNFKCANVIQKEDVDLAVALETENRQTRQQYLSYKELLQISTVYNAKEFPQIRRSVGLRIPPDNLTNANFKIKSKQKPSAHYPRPPYYAVPQSAIIPNQVPLSLNPLGMPMMNPVPLHPMHLQGNAMMHFPFHGVAGLCHPSALVSSMSQLSQIPQSAGMQKKSKGGGMQMEPQKLVFRPKFNVTHRQ